MKSGELIHTRDQDYLDMLKFEEIEELIKRLRGGTGRMKMATVGEVIHGLEWMRNYCRGQGLPRSTKAWAANAEIELGRLRLEKRQLVIENDILKRKLRRKNERRTTAAKKGTNILSGLFGRKTASARRVSSNPLRLRAVLDNGGRKSV